MDHQSCASVCIFALVVAALFLGGYLLVMYAVTAALAKKAFIGLLLGGITCLVVSFCCCFWFAFAFW